jgi:hypothetical protein
LGICPLTEAEVAYAGQKAEADRFEDLIRIAEIDGEPVAFMMTLPDLNEQLVKYGGSLWPFNWAKLLWWLNVGKPQVTTMRVPLMGVVKKLAGHPHGQPAGLHADRIYPPRRDCQIWRDARRFRLGAVVQRPDGSVGEAVGGTVNKVYRIYEKAL